MQRCTLLQELSQQGNNGAHISIEDMIYIVPLLDTYRDPYNNYYLGVTRSHLKPAPPPIPPHPPRSRHLFCFSLISWRPLVAYQRAKES